MFKNDRAAVWIGHGAQELIFYPFGIENPGYRVPGEREDTLARWTFWRAQMPVILWFLGFVPVVAIWAPHLSKSGRLQPLSAVVALTLLTAVSWALARILNQGLYYWLLRDYPVLDRSPTRIEKQASVKQHGVSYKNIAFSCFPVATLGISACAVTMLLGAIREDLTMWTLGALVSGIFWYAFGRQLFVEGS
jgi:hypothetical protein